MKQLFYETDIIEALTLDSFDSSFNLQLLCFDPISDSAVRPYVTQTVLRFRYVSSREAEVWCGFDSHLQKW